MIVVLPVPELPIIKRFPGIQLEMEDLAAALFAEAAHKDSRTGARALRPIFGKLINPLEFDPWAGDELEERAGGGWKLNATADTVRALTHR